VRTFDSTSVQLVRKTWPLSSLSKLSIAELSAAVCHVTNASVSVSVNTQEVLNVNLPACLSISPITGRKLNSPV
jgi:broad specificity polyphosphatase/5'/3'-nucleotidase SurE